MKLRATGGGTSTEREAAPAREKTPGLLVVRDGKYAWVHFRGETWRLERVVERPDGAPEEEHDLRAPMPGKVVKVLVAEGDEVVKGTPLLLLEAMKMEHEIKSPRAGKVARLFHGVGEMVTMGEPLVEID